MAVEIRDTLGNVVTEQTCRNWINKFEDGNFSFNDTAPVAHLMKI